MKTRNIWCIPLFLVSSLIAQPTVDQSAIIDLGEGEQVQFLALDASSFQPGGSGSDQTWDLSQIPEDPNACFFEAMDAELSVYRDSFPNADVFFVCVNTSAEGEMVENHTFYTYDDNIVSLAGTVSRSISDPDFDTIFTIFTNLQTFLQFPYTFGSAFEDDYEARVTTHIGDMTFALLIDGALTSTVDAFGTISTQAGTFTNALRIYREEIHENIVPGVPVTTTNEAHRYTWMAENENYLIMNMDSLVAKDAVGQVVDITFSGFYRDRGPITSTQEGLPDITEATVYPNPAKDRTTLRFTSAEQHDVVVELIDIEGRSRSAPITLQSVQPSVFEHQLEVSHLPKGTYFVRLSVQNSSGSRYLPLTIR